MSDNQIRAPWTPEQVEALNRWQASDFVHPYTCGHCRDADPDFPLRDEHRLTATQSGWVCPTCHYTQDWALAMMLEVEHFDFRAQLMKAMEVAGANVIDLENGGAPK